MPKKFVGENSKAVAAKSRKNAAKEEQNIKQEKLKEDEYWKEDDKHITKKLQRKETQEKKKLDQLQKKEEVKSLLLQEESSTVSKSSTKAPAKISRAQIEFEREQKQNVTTKEKKKEMTHLDQPLEENLNSMDADVLTARTVTEAISALSTKDDVDMHPEKRLKAAFTAFQAANMPRIKEENPTLRLSQLNQILKKEWLKSPDNPLNKI